MNPDFVDLLRAFLAADVRFLVVGAYALAVHVPVHRRSPEFTASYGGHPSRDDV
jgi:hypothetical protein